MGSGGEGGNSEGEDSNDEYSDVLEEDSADIDEESNSTTTKKNKHDVVKTCSSSQIDSVQSKDSEDVISDELPYTFEGIHIYI